MTNVDSRVPTCPSFIVTLRERGHTAIHDRCPRSGRGSDRFLDPKITFLTIRTCSFVRWAVAGCGGDGSSSTETTRFSCGRGVSSPGHQPSKEDSKSPSDSVPPQSQRGVQIATCVAGTCPEAQDAWTAVS
jgi:hypothetical protein